MGAFLFSVGPASPGKCVVMLMKGLPSGRHFASGELLGKAPQVTKGACSWLGSSFVGIPSLRRRSVGSRRTDIHVLTALSPHPCRSAHSARPTFSLHQGRDLCRLGYLRKKIKSRSTASRLRPFQLAERVAFSGTGFSREEAGVGAGNVADVQDRVNRSHPAARTSSSAHFT